MRYELDFIRELPGQIAYFISIGGPFNRPNSRRNDCIFGLLSIWFNDPTRLATTFGLMSAGLAFALQQVVTALAGYLVILRGSTFTVGDRISMGDVL